MTSTLRRTDLAALLLLAAACGSSGTASRSTASAPRDYPGFPSQANYANLAWVEATLYTDHAEIFDANLIKDEGIVPVALKIGLRGEGSDSATLRLTPDDMDLRLYLQDGTALSPVPYSKIKTKKKKKTQERVTREALKTSLLEVWEQAEEGFVFFRLAPREQFEFLGGNKVVHESGGVSRELELDQSLVVFQVTTMEGSAPLHVGLRRDVRGGRR